MKERTWKDFKPDYESLLDFIDVFYSATLGVGLVLIGLIFDHHFDYGGLDWAPLILLSFSILYLVGDYVDSRLFTAQYPYEGLARFFIDLGIGLIFFGSFISAYHSSPYFLLAMATAFLLGGVWCVCLQCGVADAKPLYYPVPVSSAHFFASGVFVWLWWEHHSQRRLFVPDALKAISWYAIWATFYVAAEIILNIPPKEADLLPNFPIGRIARRLKFVAIVRKRLVARSLPIIAASLKWLSTKTNEFTARLNEGTSPSAPSAPPAPLVRLDPSVLDEEPTTEPRKGD